MFILSKLKSAIFSNDPVANLIKFVVIFVGLIIFTIFMSNASTAQDWEWYKNGFTDQPNRLIIYKDGQQTELLPGQTDFEEIAEAVTASLNQGVDTQSGTGLSEVSLDEAYNRFTTLEVFFAQPVKLHTWFFTGHPTQMLFPLTGRHSDWPIVFLGEEGVYRSNAPVLKTKDPILTVMRKLGYLEP
jgi:hypothetical protein